MNVAKAAWLKLAVQVPLNTRFATMEAYPVAEVVVAPELVVTPALVVVPVVTPVVPVVVPVVLVVAVVRTRRVMDLEPSGPNTLPEAGTNDARRV